VMPDAFNDANRELIIALAARYGVPATYYNRFFSEPREARPQFSVTSAPSEQRRR
jgi:hypothetical protein